MKSMVAKIQHLLKFPPHIIVQKAYNRVIQRIHRKRDKKFILEKDIRTKVAPKLRSNIFKLAWLETDHLDVDVFVFLNDQYTQHRFDNLGSHWLSNAYDAQSPGLEGHHFQHNVIVSEFDKEGRWLSQVVIENHLKESQRFWTIIQKLNPNYIPIDWQKDIKSGFRWSAKKWFREQRQMSDGQLGADIKMPWELSRLQHLARMVLLAKMKPEEEINISKEILCQLLDFIMANPIGMGANFNCPMDIGIRNANILMVYDWLKQIDKNLANSEIDAIVSRFVYHSTQHILADIEYREGKTSNHYLGNVLGVLYAGVYLESQLEVDQFLAFGLQELHSSIFRQFFNDGSNFEGSTAYHRLSGEMVIYGLGVALLSSPEQRLKAANCDKNSWKYKSPLNNADFEWVCNPDDGVWKRLLNMAHFSVGITKPNGDIPQFGDNDSGRFVNLSPFGQFERSEQYTRRYEQITDVDLLPNIDKVFDENCLNQGGFISSILGLFNKEKAIPKAVFARTEFQLFEHIVAESGLKLKTNEEPFDNEHANSSFSFSDYTKWEFNKKTTYDINAEQHAEFKAFTFPDFQLAVLKNESLYIALVGICNPKQHHSMAHVHNDKGSVELVIDGEMILQDPGTYLYTPIPERRIQFRSIKAHNTIVVNSEEQNKPLPGAMGLFNMTSMVQCIGPEVKGNEMRIELHYGQTKHLRSVRIENDKVVIEDWCNRNFVQNFNAMKAFSNGYGRLINK